MERRSAGNWFALAAALGALAIIGYYLADRFEARHGLALWLFMGGLLMTVLAVLTAAAGSVLLYMADRVPKVRYRAAVDDEVYGIHRVSLRRTDGQDVGYATCVVVAAGGHEMTPDAVDSGETVAYLFPDAFKQTLPERLELGKCRIRWYVSTRGTAVLTKFADKPTAKARFKVSPEVRDRAARVWRRGRFEASHSLDGKMTLRLFRHEATMPKTIACYVSRHLEDESFGAPFLGVVGDERAEKAEGTEVILIYPDDFRRETGEAQTVRHPDGITELIHEYDYPTGEAGRYIVRWVQVWYVTGGVFEAEHEITPEDFRREAEIAWDYFELGEPR